MKLLHQLNIAFCILLVIVLGSSALLMNSFLLQILIQDQRSALKDKGNEWLTHIEEKGGSITQQDIEQLLRIPAKGGKLEVLLLEKGKVIYTTLPAGKVDKWAELVKESRKNHTNTIKVGEKEQYLVEYNTVKSVESEPKRLLVLAAPLRGLQSVRMVLAKRMFLILAFGGIVALILSYIMTQLLVKPLSRVNLQLKKIQDRSFSDVELVHANGEIRDVAKSVYQLAHELDRYTKTQKHFFQNGSHELKTPLMSIQGYAEGIRDGVFTGDAVSKGLDVIISESKRLKNIVTEMTLLAKLESEEGIYQIEPINVKEIIHLSIERMSPLASKKGIQIIVEDELRNEASEILLGDMDKVLQAMINILGNAIRYAKQQIVMKYYDRDQWLIIDIIDDGEGIPEDLLPHLFQRFVKGKEGGTGLGLAISRAIIERCGGEIHVRNAPSCGAVFSLYFAKKK